MILSGAYIGMTESFKIPYPRIPAQRKAWNSRYSLNAYWSGKHWKARKDDADYWHLLTRSEMDKQRVRRKPFEKPVIITFYWNSRLDIDNNSAIAKMVVDSIKKRVIQDDSRRWLAGVEHYFHDGDFIKIIIREVDYE